MNEFNYFILMNIYSYYKNYFNIITSENLQRLVYSIKERMNKFIITLLVLYVSNCYSYSDFRYVEEKDLECNQLSDEWKSKQHYLPEVFYVEGVASGYLPVEKVIIFLTV